MTGDTKLYSVLLVYPDYMADAYGEETYLAYAIAENVKEAVTIARQKAWKDSEVDQEDLNPDCFEDFFVSFVCEGYIFDIKE